MLFPFSIVGFANMHWFGIVNQTQRALVTDLFGESITSLLSACNGSFSEKTTVLLAYQMISRIEQLHTYSRCVHRDIKADNFYMGRDLQKHTVYLSDFYETQSYLVDRGESHIRFHQAEGHFVGTRRYASLHAHLGIGKMDCIALACSASAK
jgi:serine/threonine protein kinase